MTAKTKTKKASVPAKAKKTEIANPASLLMPKGISGLENITSNDIKIPILTIVQDLSPQRKKNKPEYIEGCDVGDIINTAATDVYEEVDLIICAYKMNIIEWLPNRQGLVKVHGSDRSILSKTEPSPETGKPTLPNGNIVMEHAEYYVMNMTAGGRKEMISMTWAQMAVSKKLMTQISNEKIWISETESVQAPLWNRVWKFGVVERQGDAGDCFIWSPKPGELLIDRPDVEQLAPQIISFHENVTDGVVTGDLSTMSDGEESEQSEQM